MTDATETTEPPKHPAKYSKQVMNAIIREVTGLVSEIGETIDWYVLDPFGGVGGIFDLHRVESDFDPGDVTLRITSVELEPEWADQGWEHPRFRDEVDHVHTGDFFKFAAHPSNSRRFDLVVTSCTYGNRMADHHTPSPEDTSKRNTYRHTLGRPLTEGNSGMMQWGDEYRDFHRGAWVAVYQLIEPGGYFILNVKDHIRQGVKQPVVAWHRATAKWAGFDLVREIQVGVRGNRQGENGDVRVDGESVFVFQRPWQTAGDTRYAEQSILKGGHR